MEQRKRRVGRPRARVANQNLTIRLPHAAIDRLAELAIKREVSVNQMARIIVLRGLNQDYDLDTALFSEKEPQRLKDIMNNMYEEEMILLQN